MPRPPLALGTWGHIKRTKVDKGRWYADGRYRAQNGRTRRIRRYSPEGVFDREGAAAERVLIEAMKSACESTGDLDGTTTIDELWTAYRVELVESGRAPRTLTRYDDVAEFIGAQLGGLRLQEVSTQRLETFLRSVAEVNGVGNAKSTRSVLSGMFSMATRLGVVKANPVRDTKPPTSKSAKQPRSLEPEQLAKLLVDLRQSTIPCPAVGKGGVPIPSKYRVPSVAEYCASVDLVDVITMFAATGVRMSELIGMTWPGLDLQAKTITLSEKAARVPGKGLVLVSRDDDPKNTNRTLALPDFAMTMLRARKLAAPPNAHQVIFPSKAGTIRDADAMNVQWRRVRAALGLDWVTAHTFRRTVASLLDESKMGPRITADQLGHASPSMTMDKYMSRGKVRPEVAAILDAAVKVESKRRVEEERAQ
ncbi:integrase [Rhodococcus percolatus]|uniref:tyrosine-type recombinase/integrase n=1 Tax=Rhodococcus opacus TaxID=37919 RepID=UPI0015FDC85D|nr:site-specific integrase [Rhodococcus opacus]MBA8964655.1 integrase [Rhodococcus opacus]MBP2208207.1 integrase [Rhodococcus opacus]